MTSALSEVQRDREREIMADLILGISWVSRCRGCIEWPVKGMGLGKLEMILLLLRYALNRCDRLVPLLNIHQWYCDCWIMSKVDMRYLSKCHL